MGPYVFLFSAVDSLGESIAVDLVTKREEKLFTSKRMFKTEQD